MSTHLQNRRNKRIAAWFFLLVGLLLAAPVLISPDAQAQADTVTVSTMDYVINDVVNDVIDVEVNLAPGDTAVGSVEFEILYDTSLVAPELNADSGLPLCTTNLALGWVGSCGPANPDGSITVALFNIQGAPSESLIVTLPFTAVGPGGVSPLDIVIGTGSDVGGQPLPFEDTDGSITIAGAATATPTAEPTATPTVEATATPTAEPTATPTAEPTATPTTEPTATPTAEPTATPTAEATATPTAEATATPTAEATATPTAEATATPTAEATATPTAEATATPTAEATATPTAEATATPTAEATATPTAEATATPTAEATATPTAEATAEATATPTAIATAVPTVVVPTVEVIVTLPEDPGTFSNPPSVLSISGAEAAFVVPNAQPAETSGGANGAGAGVVGGTGGAGDKAGNDGNAAGGTSGTSGNTGSGPGLANTGAETPLLAALSVLMLSIGGVLMVSSRRRTDI